MKYGLQTHFDGPLHDAPVLAEVRRRRFDAVRIDAQNGDPQKLIDAMAEAKAHGLEGVPILPVDQPGLMGVCPPDTIVLLGNEHDPGGIGRQIGAADYRQLLDIACIIALNHPVQLFAPELSNLDQNSIDWLNAVKGNGWPKGLAGISFHRYGKNATWETPHTGFSSRDREIHWLKAAAAGLPLACTEFGWGSKRGMTEALQASHMKREWIFLRTNGIVLAVQYQLNDGTTEGEDFGIKDGDRWKPVADSIPNDVPGQEPTPVPVPDPDPATVPVVDPGGDVDHLAGLLQIALKAANGRYVTAENGGDADGILRANDRGHDDAGPWQRFGVVPMPDGRIALKTIHGRYWCAEGGGSTTLVANRTKADIWESFTPSAPLTHGATISLQTFDGTHVVCCEVGSHDPLLVANRDRVGPWEQFQVDVLAGRQPASVLTRSGLVVAQGRALLDAQGTARLLGITFFWALYGWKHERDRVLAHLRWFQDLAAQGAQVDFLRILAEVDWFDRSIVPSWPDYSQVLGDFLDAAWAHGLRCKLTLIGGKDGRGLAMKTAQLVAPVVNLGRQHMVTHYEVANEWNVQNKIDLATMVQVGKYLRANTPNLVALSAPRAGEEVEGTAPPVTTQAMLDAAKQCGAQVQPLHTRRKNHDHGWAQPRQSYDFSGFNLIGDHGEGPGLQSSGESITNKLQLSMMRLLGIMCGAPLFCIHVGQGVTGRADAKHGRPENMWDVPDIVDTIRAVRVGDTLLPSGIENGQVVNNGGNNSPHPLRLDSKVGIGFWEASREGGKGSVNKNYGVLLGDRFIIALLGVHSTSDDDGKNLVLVGTPKRAVRVQAFDPTTGQAVGEQTDLKPGQGWFLPGRVDTQVGYIVQGQIL